MYLEVQVRTLFEEGWGEIDHHILYPYKKQNPMLTEFSELLNRLTGMGDEMGILLQTSAGCSGDAFLDKRVWWMSGGNMRLMKPRSDV